MGGGATGGGGAAQPAERCRHQPFGAKAGAPAKRMWSQPLSTVPAIRALGDSCTSTLPLRATHAAWLRDAAVPLPAGADPLAGLPTPDAAFPTLRDRLHALAAP